MITHDITRLIALLAQTIEIPLFFSLGEGESASSAGTPADSNDIIQEA